LLVNNAIRVGIVNADSDITAGRKLVLESTGRIALVLDEQRPEDLLEKFENYLIDVLLVDQRLRGMSGVELCEKLTKVKIEQGVETRLMVTAAFGSPRLTFDALSAGANAVVTQDQGPKTLIETLYSLNSRKQQQNFEQLRELVSNLDIETKEDPVVQVLLDSFDELETKLFAAVVSGSSIASVSSSFDVAGYRIRKLIQRSMELLKVATLEQMQLKLIQSGEKLG
jgi:DNA-binding NarL/FixJ family response regulator